MDKLFFHRMWTKSVLGVYSSVLGVLKEYVCLFQKDECSVHLLHDQQMTLFKRFLAMFVKPEAFHDLEPQRLINAKQLDLKKEENLLLLQDMSIGASTQSTFRISGQGQIGVVVFGDGPVWFHELRAIFAKETANQQ